MEGVVDEMVVHRASGTVPECPILETLFDSGDKSGCSIGWAVLGFDQPCRCCLSGKQRTMWLGLPYVCS